MANSYFQFKQFKIEQAHCAMKVCTEACIQGAWSQVPNAAQHALDIGTGTGVLALMLAQRYPTLQIDAVELDHAAAIQAQENFGNAPFRNRLSLFNVDINLWQCSKQYDFIICNPPFFSHSLKSPKANRNLARHNDSLSFEQLLAFIEQHLNLQGSASVLLPKSEWKHWELLLSKSSLHCVECLEIFSYKSQAANSKVYILKPLVPKTSLNTHQLFIYDAPKVYSPEMKNLLKDFYLYL